MRTAFFTVLITLTLSSSPALAADESWIEPIHDSPYHLRIVGDEARGTVPIRLERSDLRLADISIDQVSATFDQIDPEIVTQAFSVDLQPGEDTAPHRIRVIFDPSEIPEQDRFGTYELAIDLSAPGAEEGADRRGQSIDLDVVYPQTELFDLQPLVVEQTRLLFLHPADWNFLGFGVRGAPLYLKAEKGQLPAEFDIQQFRPAKVDDMPIPGHLEGGPPTRDGKVVRIPMKIEEQFPLGDATGTLHVDAPEMELATVAFTVKTREHWILILLIVAVGLLAGFFLRTYLETFLERQRQRLKLQKLLQRVVQSRALGRDPKFTEELESLETDLMAALRQTRRMSDEDFASKLQAWQKRLDDAIVAFEGRRTQLAARAAEIQDLSSYDWRLPSPFEPPLSTARTALSSVETVIETGDLKAAEATLKKLTDTLRRDLTAALETWYKNLLPELRGLPSRVKPPFPDSVSPKLTEALEKLGSKREIPLPTTDPVQAIEKMLTSAYEGNQIAAGLFDRLAGEVAAVATGVADALDQKLAGNPRIEELMAARRMLRKSTWRPLLDKPTEGIAEFETTVEQATRALQRAIHEPYVMEGKGVPEAAEDCIAEGKYLEAARIAATADSVIQPLGNVDSQAVPRVVDLEEPTWTLLTETANVTKRPVAIRRPELHERLQAEITRTWKEIRRAERLQSIVAGVGLALVAVLIFRDSFVGTVENCITVFLWGFITDVGINSLVSKVTPLAKPSSG